MPGGPRSLPYKRIVGRGAVLRSITVNFHTSLLHAVAGLASFLARRHSLSARDDNKQQLFPVALYCFQDESIHAVGQSSQNDLSRKALANRLSSGIVLFFALGFQSPPLTLR